MNILFTKKRFGCCPVDFSRRRISASLFIALFLVFFAGCQRIESNRINSELIISDYSSITVEGSATTEGRIGVRMRTNPVGYVSIPLRVSDETEARIVSDRVLTFNHLNFNKEQTIRIVGVSDDLRDGDVPYSLIFGQPLFNSTNKNFDETQILLVNVDVNVPEVIVSEFSSDRFTYEGPVLNSVNFSVKLSSRPEGAVPINLTSLNTGEGRITRGSQLTFNESNWNIPQVVTVAGQDDAVADGNIDYIIDIAPINSPNTGYHGLDPDNVVLTNRDNDTPQLVLTKISNFTVNEDRRNFTGMLVRLATRPTGPVLVEVRNTSLDTFIEVCGSGNFLSYLSFDETNWDRDQNCLLIAHPTENDNIVNGTEVAAVRFDTSFSGDAFYQNLVSQTENLRVEDDDEAGIMIDVSDPTVTETGKTADVAVRLTSEPETDVYLELTIVQNLAEADIQSVGILGSTVTTLVNAKVATLHFSPNNWNVNRRVTFVGLDDNQVDGNKEFKVEVAVNQRSTLDPNYQTALNNNSQVFTLVNIDNDTPGIWIPRVSGSLTETGGVLEVDVQLTGSPMAGTTVSVPFRVDDLSEARLRGTASPFVFTSANWNVSQTITLEGVNDDFDDGDANLNLVFEPLSSTTPNDGFDRTDPRDYAVVNHDDDVNGVILSDLNGLPGENGEIGILTVSLGANPLADVNVNVSIVTGANLVEVISPTGVFPLLFSNSTWNVPQQIVIRGRDLDSRYSLNQTAVLGFAVTSINQNYNNIAVPNLAVPVVDNDAPEVQTLFPANAMSEAGGSLAISVNLVPSPAGKVVLRAASSNTAQARIVSNTLTWQNGSWLNGNTFTVAAVNDADQDGNQNVPITVWLDKIATTDNVYKLLNFSVTQTITVIDDD